MATIKQDITKPFSRRLNGLCEIQRWFPAYIRNDGEVGLSVDPVLFYTTFNPKLKQEIGDGLDDESRTAGVRVEMINHDGSTPSGTPTIQILGSGTLDARCIITHEDGTKTEFRFVAPSGDVKLSNVYGSQTTAGAGGMEQGSDTSPDNPTLDFSSGPYPVFITLQEFTHWLDGNLNRFSKATVDALGANVNDPFYKKAWLPFGLVGDGTIPSTSSFPEANADPRIDSNNNAVLPTVSKICATLWMPLLYDNNQLDKTQGSGTHSNDIVQGAWDGSAGEDGSNNTNTYRNFYDEGMTRYSQQPDDGAEYKWWDDAGDLRTGEYAAFQRNDPVGQASNQFDYSNPDITPASSATGNPSFRMRSALACFLADGTYPLIGGSIIPYVYDDTRKVGGRDGTTVYSVWNGKGGIDLTQSQLDNVETNMMSSAQIFPLYDFIQGPLCPPAQGWNYDMDVDDNWYFWMDTTTNLRQNRVAYNAGTWTDRLQNATMRVQPRSGVVRPNPIRAKIFAAQQVGSAGTTSITTSTTATMVLEVWVEDTTGGYGTSSRRNVWKTGMPVNMQFNSGIFAEVIDSNNNPLVRNIVGSSKWLQKVVGTGNPKPEFNAVRYPSTTTSISGGANTTSMQDNFFSGRSGWWIINKVEAQTAVAKSSIVSGATGTFNGHKLSFVVNAGQQTNQATNTRLAYELTKSYISQGIMGGSEHVFGGKWEYVGIGGTGETYDGWKQTNLNVNGTTPYGNGGGTADGLGSRRGLGMNKYNIIPIGYSAEGSSLQVLGTGLGFVGGVCGSNNVPAYANTQWRFPNAVCFDPQSLFLGTVNGFNETGSIQPSPRGTLLTSGLGDGLVNVPTANSFSGNILRLAAPQTFGHSNFYYSVSAPEGLAYGTMYLAGDFPLLGGAINDGSAGDEYHAWKSSGADGTGSVSDGSSYKAYQGSRFGSRPRWVSKSLTLLCMSAFDQATGKHAFDHIQKVGLGNGRNQIWPVHERIGTKKGYGNFQTVVGIGAANKDKTASGFREIGESTKTSLTEVGCSPVFLDFEMSAWIPQQKERFTIIEFDTGVPHALYGRHTHETHNFESFGARGGFQYLSDPNSTNLYWQGWANVGAPYVGNEQHEWNSEIWFFAGSDIMANTAFDAATNGGFANWGSWPFSGLGNTGFGQMGNLVGTGGSTNIAEGYHQIRAVFDEGGMTFIVDGNTVGKDLNSNNPVWGLSIISGNLHIRGINAGDNPIKDSRNRQMWWAGEAFQKSDADLMIDAIRLRHIPTPAMLPFTVDTVNQKIAGVSKYTALTVEADNIKPAKNMDVKVSICPVIDNNPTTVGAVGRQIEGGTPYTNFDNLSLDFVGGFGSIDLENLPADAITNGFVIRFNFYVPSSADVDLHPVDWSTTPIIRSWSLEHDIAPTTTLSVIGNTFNGDTTAPIDSKVGHIISFNASGATSDVDRVLTAFKFDFGDGVITEFLPLSDQTQTSATMNTAHSYLTAGTYQASCFVKDDNNNITQSSTVQIVVADAAPVAVLKAIPSLTRAGTAVRLDATDSFDINAGGSISNYTFTFGDGSNSVSNASGTVQHTYATAGEYQATLVCTDASGLTSQTASAVIKVLPATLVIPLTFNVRPTAFSRTRAASMSQTQVLDATYPELTDTGQRSDEMTLNGLFLHSTANADIAFVEELMLAGSLVEFLYEDVDYDGNPSGRTFVGRITSFDYEREGGQLGQTPYTITMVREAGLGV